MDSDSVVVTFTRNSFETMQELGGSGDWKASAERLAQVQYVVCVRNRRPRYDTETVTAQDFDHGTAFLIGKVSGIEEYDDYDYCVGPRRRVLISHYQHIAIANAWDGWQNPVHYLSLKEAQNRFGRFVNEPWKKFSRAC